MTRCVRVAVLVGRWRGRRAGRRARRTGHELVRARAHRWRDRGRGADRAAAATSRARSRSPSRYMVVLARRASVPTRRSCCSSRSWSRSWFGPSRRRPKDGSRSSCERLAEGLAAVVVFHGVVPAVGRPTERAGVLLALGCRRGRADRRRRAGRMVRERSLAIPMHGRTADLALITSAILMGSATWASTVPTGWVSGDPLSSRSRCSRPGTRTSSSTSSAPPTTRRSARSARHRSSAAWCARVTPSVSRRSRVAIGHELGFSRRRDRSARDRGAAPPPRPGAVSTNPRTVARPIRRRSRKSARRDSAQHAAARAGRRHHRGGADAHTATRPGPSPSVLCRAGPQDHERVRRAVLGRSRRVRPSRSKALLLRARLHVRRAGAGGARGRARQGRRCSTDASRG